MFSTINVRYIFNRKEKFYDSSQCEVTYSIYNLTQSFYDMRQSLTCNAMNNAALHIYVEGTDFIGTEKNVRI